MVGEELANNIQQVTRGEDGQDVFDTLFGVLCGLYAGAPIECQAQMLARVLRTLEAQLGIVVDIKQREKNSAAHVD